MTKPSPKKSKSAPSDPAADTSPASNDTFVFRLSDFRSIEISMSLINTTTGLPIESSRSCVLVEFLDDGLIVEVPTRSCAKGHHILATVSGTLPNSDETDPSKATRVRTPTKRVEFTAKVRNLTPQGDATDALELVFIQRDEKEWKEFQALLTNRQDEVNELLKAIRGW